MNRPVIEVDDYMHPEERAVTNRIVALTQMDSWAESGMGEGLDDTNQYICSASYFAVPSRHMIAREAEAAAELFGLGQLPKLYIARKFSYDLQLSGYHEPTVIVPSALVDEHDEGMIRCRICGALAGVKAGHHQLEYLLWIIENMSGSIPIPFASQAACTLLYEWKRAIRYSQDRAVYLATGNLEEALRNILYGTVPQETLKRFTFGSNGTFDPQVRRYSKGLVEKTVGAFASLMQDYAYLPERYSRLIQFAEGRSGQ